MSREEIYSEIKGMLGIVPSFLKTVPDSTLELEWKLMKSVEMDEGAIPNKYRDLIGLGIAAATKCKYCTLFHSEMAKLFGASDAEIEEAVHYAKSVAGWSTYVNGMQEDYDRFKSEVAQIREYVMKQQLKKAA